MAAYEVTVTREDDLWVAVVAGLSPAATDVAHFAELETEVRDLIAGLTDSDPDDFAINWRYHVGGRDVTDLLRRLAALEEELHVAASARDETRLAAIEALAEAGMSQRVIGDVLNLSHQRVNQLLNR